jgi:hypothetical protein
MDINISNHTQRVILYWYITSRQVSAMNVGLIRSIVEYVFVVFVLVDKRLMLATFMA